MSRCYIPEKYMRAMIKEYLNSNEIQYKREARVYNIPIDFIGVTNSRDVYSVQLKTKDFKKAIGQANRDCMFADYSVIAVWRDYLSDSLISRIDSTGLGLWSVDETVSVVSEPIVNQPNQYAREHAIERVIE